MSEQANEVAAQAGGTPSSSSLKAPGLDPDKYKNKATSPNLHIARVQIYQVMSVDLASLVHDYTDDIRILQKLRADDSLRKALARALLGPVAGCEREASSVRRRMEDSVRLRGKAIWTDQFLDRFAPIKLPTPHRFISVNDERVVDSRLSDEIRSPLHYVRYRRSHLQIFGDGTLTYTVHLQFDDQPSSRHRVSTTNPPASISEAIDRLEAIDELMTENFVSALRELLRPDSFRATIRRNLTVSDAGHGLELVNADDIQPGMLGLKTERHRLIFVEHFFDGNEISTLSPQAHNTAKVNLQEVLESSSLAGLLNAASWYKNYDERYIRSLAAKEIGYRNDEIYLTDRKSTVVCSKGFWNEGTGHANPADPLTLYKLDIVLAIEFNLARLAYLASLLTYYQRHVDVQNVENAEPLSVLSRVIDGRAILSHIEESLDLILLVDHGFTRLLINRLREELGLESTLNYIRRRITDASESVNLKSAVKAASETSVVSLKESVENNKIQREIRVWAIIAVVVAVALSLLNLLTH